MIETYSWYQYISLDSSVERWCNVPLLVFCLLLLGCSCGTTSETNSSSTTLLTCQSSQTCRSRRPRWRKSVQFKGIPASKPWGCFTRQRHTSILCKKYGLQSDSQTPSSQTKLGNCDRTPPLLRCAANATFMMFLLVLVTVSGFWCIQLSTYWESSFCSVPSSRGDCVKIKFASHILPCSNRAARNTSSQITIFRSLLCGDVFFERILLVWKQRGWKEQDWWANFFLRVN